MSIAGSIRLTASRSAGDGVRTTLHSLETCLQRSAVACGLPLNDLLRFIVDMTGVAYRAAIRIVAVYSC
ncbi:MAG: hypothetical protein RIC55_03595 [Pirellulaceae bacterium]